MNISFLLFLIVGYLIHLPRGFSLTQDLVKIVGSPDFPGINKCISIANIIYIINSNFKKAISICLNCINLVQKAKIPQLSWSPKGLSHL